MIDLKTIPSKKDPAAARQFAPKQTLDSAADRMHTTTRLEPKS